MRPTSSGTLPYLKGWGQEGGHRFAIRSAPSASLQQGETLLLFLRAKTNRA